MADETRTIKIVVKAEGDGDLKHLSAEMERMRKDTLAARKEMEQSNKTLAGMRKEAMATRRELAQTNQTLGGFGSTIGKVSKVLGAFGLAHSFKALVQQSESYQSLTKQISDLGAAFFDAAAAASGLKAALKDPTIFNNYKSDVQGVGTFLGDLIAEAKSLIDATNKGTVNAAAFGAFSDWLRERGKTRELEQTLENILPATKAEMDALTKAALEQSKLGAQAADDMARRAQFARDVAESEKRIAEARRASSPAGLRAAGADANLHPVTSPGPNVKAFAEEMDKAARAVGDISIDTSAIGASLETMTIETFGWTDALEEATGYMREMQAFQADMVTQALAWGDALTYAFKGVLTGELHNTRDLLRSITTEMRDFYAELASRAATELLMGFLRGLITGGTQGGATGNWSGPRSAKGNAFDEGHVIPMAKGAIVTGPTLFPMARGMGLMGEAGPEAVLPLKRGSDGRLGVSSSTPRIVINNQTGVSAQASVLTSDDRLEITLRAASMGANMAVADMNRSIRTGYGSTAQSLSRSYGLRRRV